MPKWGLLFRSHSQDNRFVGCSGVFFDKKDSARVAARASIGAFLEKIYNPKRLHSALGYVPPAEFERGWLAQNHKEAARRHLPL